MSETSDQIIMKCFMFCIKEFSIQCIRLVNNVKNTILTMLIIEKLIIFMKIIRLCDKRMGRAHVCMYHKCGVLLFLIHFFKFLLGLKM